MVTTGSGCNADVANESTGRLIAIRLQQSTIISNHANIFELATSSFWVNRSAIIIRIRPTIREMEKSASNPMKLFHSKKKVLQLVTRKSLFSS